MKKLIVLLTTISFIATSCSKSKTAADRVITKENIKQDLADIVNENPQLDSTKIELIKSYIYITEGREVYLDSLIEGEESKRELFSNYIVNAEDFERQVSNIFLSFKNDGYTYQMFFDVIDSIEDYRVKFQKEKLDGLYKKVEEECQRRQEISGFIASATDMQKDSMLYTDTDLAYLADGQDTVTIKDLNLALDYKYETPNELFGFCPYMSNREPIAAEIRRVRAERDNYIREHFTSFKKYNENYSKLFK